MLWISTAIPTLRAATLRVYRHEAREATIIYVIIRHGACILLSKLALLLLLLFELTSSITGTLADVLLLFLSRPKAMSFQLPH
ncbi:hypothetical protein BDV24DRAFT_89257 [Aspergillus arachidicola]|uniref:Uncharacterized protein n=1 Tax=Aspergillus arachidicola TaxID=656916 RepID=A0A5N6XYL2_9EURO|nr:hypothetical protein BDV24DRAFT_89257 [Aspergillus arachidicola]